MDERGPSGTTEPDRYRLAAKSTLAQSRKAWAITWFLVKSLLEYVIRFIILMVLLFYLLRKKKTNEKEIRRQRLRPR